MLPAVRRFRTYLRYLKNKQYFRQQFRTRDIGEAFAEIYRRGGWGQAEGEEFFSGSGSTPQFAAAYADLVNRFVELHAVRHIVDLGCGDFQVGRLLKTSERVRYTGMDIVKDLVSHNQAKYGSAFVEFRCGDAIKDELPDGDLCLVRQVLQHLSNAQITAVMRRCSKYRYILVTEDIYTGPGTRPNLDKPAGWDTRTYAKSGVFLDQAPFSLSVHTELEVPNPPNMVLRTSLIENPGATTTAG